MSPLLLALFLCSSLLFGEQFLHVESGYAETLTDTQPVFGSVRYQNGIWEAGYALRYPVQDLTGRVTLPLYRNGYFRQTLHANTRNYQGWNLDAETTLGQDLTTKNGRFHFFYGAGLQLSWYAHTQMTSILHSQTFAFHLTAEYRFWEDRAGISLSYDSSAFFWYNYYIYTPIITLAGNVALRDDLLLTFSARCRNSDFWKENRAITMVEFKAGCLWRLP